jgi:hypothetical protein
VTELTHIQNLKWAISEAMRGLGVGSTKAWDYLFQVSGGLEIAASQAQLILECDLYLHHNLAQFEQLRCRTPSLFRATYPQPFVKRVEKEEDNSSDPFSP